MNTLIRWLLAVVLAGMSLQATALRGEHLTFCGDGAGWPPYTFELNGEVLGYDLDVLDAILTPAGITFDVVMLPWSRCLQQTESGEFHIALSASFNEQRARTYIYTDSYYTVNLVYVYDSNRHPNGLNITQASDLNNYRMCGLRGYNYANFGVETERVDRDTSTTSQVVQKTLAGRCDLFLDRYEPLVGFSALGEVHLSGGLVASPIPGIDSEYFYMLVSRAYPRAQELADLLNAGITQLRADGALESMINRYVGD
ncbi:transporter substrate-binding domain-containing protein [Salinispirillum sp. LH 10-3-1]|uniref:Transporter substrate-binding domain-containing protein n=1 Tax=Salinispirillum sp. LH 10-3-1 TaxID=2952525 RepID=A0AB38YGV0_9GAMM